MALFRTSGPDAEPLTTTECKAHLRVSHSSDDDLIAGLIRAAREEVERHTGLALIDHTLIGWGVKQILSVTTYGSEGEASELDPASYQLDPLSRPARLHFETRPSPGIAMNGIEIDFRAGFGEAGTDVPDLLKRAMMLLVAHWYEFRAEYGAADQPVSLPEGYQRLVAGFRARRLL